MGFNANLSKFTCFFSVYTDKLYGIKQIHETGKSRIASVAAPKTCSILWYPLLKKNGNKTAILNVYSKLSS